MSLEWTILLMSHMHWSANVWELQDIKNRSYANVVIQWDISYHPANRYMFWSFACLPLMIKFDFLTACFEKDIVCTLALVNNIGVIKSLLLIYVVNNFNPIHAFFIRNLHVDSRNIQGTYTINDRRDGPVVEHLPHNGSWARAPAESYQRL